MHLYGIFIQSTLTTKKKGLLALVVETTVSLLWYWTHIIFVFCIKAIDTIIHTGIQL